MSLLCCKGLTARIAILILRTWYERTSRCYYDPHTRSLNRSLYRQNRIVLWGLIFTYIITLGLQFCESGLIPFLPLIDLTSVRSGPLQFAVSVALPLPYKDCILATTPQSCVPLASASSLCAKSKPGDCRPCQSGWQRHSSTGVYILNNLGK